jgi:glyoxylase-like metal-dependent hydrolase (beta-lactamase superfamily II)
MPGLDLRAVHTPGHTPGHLCFYDEPRRLLFGGDHVLPRISPNIPSAHGDMDPLGDFLASLAKIRDVEVDEVLPAHEWRYRDLAMRVAQLEQHHEHRLAELLAILREHPGTVPWELAGLLTWSRPWSSYDGFMRISALGETTAHLAQLVTRGEVVVSDEPVPRYLAKRTALAADSMHS